MWAVWAHYFPDTCVIRQADRSPSATLRSPALTS